MLSQRQITIICFTKETCGQEIKNTILLLQTLLEEYQQLDTPNRYPPNHHGMNRSKGHI